MDRQSNPVRLFVVHARQDRDKARQLGRWLRHHPDLRFVFDDDVAPKKGQSIWDALRDEIGRCDIALFLATPASLESGHSLVELGMIRSLQKPLLWVQTGRVPLRAPIQLDESSSVPYEDFQDPELVDDLLRSHREAASA